MDTEHQRAREAAAEEVAVCEPACEEEEKAGPAEGVPSTMRETGWMSFGDI